VVVRFPGDPTIAHQAEPGVDRDASPVDDIDEVSHAADVGFGQRCDGHVVEEGCPVFDFDGDDE
jgi:hypothetical protein